MNPSFKEKLNRLLSLTKDYAGSVALEINPSKGSRGSNVRDRVRHGEKLGAGAGFNVENSEGIKLHRASAVIEHRNAKGELLSTETSYNVKTTAGIDQLFLQGYGSSGLSTNGFNYIALSNDSLTETTASTTLSNEIAANGLSRAQGTYAHTVGTGSCTIQKIFTCATSSQSAQKAALFNASSSGVMQHALAFSSRSLLVGDTLTLTYTISIS